MWNLKPVNELGKNLLPMHESARACMGHVESTGLLTYAELQNQNHICSHHYQFIVSNSQRWMQISQNSHFSLKAQFYHWQQIASVVSLEVTGSLFHFQENACQIPKSE